MAAIIYMRARVACARAHARWLAPASAIASILILTMAGGATGSTSAVTVTASVPSSTWLSVDPAGTAPAGNCKTGAAGRTQFGTVLPGQPAVTTQDCAVVFGSGNDTAMLRMFQEDGRGKAMFMPSTGSLDTAFSPGGAEGSGKTRTEFSGTQELVHDIAMQSDGMFVVVGQTFNGANDDFAVARFESDGDLDTTFSPGGVEGSGKARTDFASGTDVAKSVAVQADGRIVVAGAAYNGTNFDFGVARYNTDGSLDTSFGTGGADGDGKVSYDFTTSTDHAWDMKLQPDGKVLMVGESYNGADTDFALVRLNTDGSLDTGFSPGGAEGNGRARTDFSTSGDIALSVALQTTGKFFVGGGSSSGTVDFGLARYNADGSLDTAYSPGGGEGNGKSRIDFSGGHDWLWSLALQPDGRLLAGGASSTGDFEIARFSVDGSLDAEFGPGGTEGDGKVMTDFSGAGDHGEAIAITTDGKILLGGGSDAGAGNWDFALAQYSSVAIDNYLDDGTADWDTPGSLDLFGACLRTVSNGASTNGTTWAADSDTGTDEPALNADCGDGDTDPWKSIAATSGGANSKVAHSTTVGDGDATAHLRFGIRTLGNQAPGTYLAPVTLEVVAPNAP